MAKDINNKNIIELVQQITPLIYYLISKYRNEEEKSLCIKLELIPNKPCLYFKRTFKINDENPLNSIKELVKDFKTEGYFITFTKHFNLQIFLEDPEIEEETELPDTIEGAEEWLKNFFLPDCVKKRAEEIAREAMIKQHIWLVGCIGV